MTVRCSMCGSGGEYWISFILMKLEFCRHVVPVNFVLIMRSVVQNWNREDKLSVNMEGPWTHDQGCSHLLRCDSGLFWNMVGSFGPLMCHRVHCVQAVIWLVAVWMNKHIFFWGWVESLFIKFGNHGSDDACVGLLFFGVSEFYNIRWRS